MKKSRYFPEQLGFSLRQAEEDPPVAEVSRKLWITGETRDAASPIVSLMEYRLVWPTCGDSAAT